MKKKPLKKQARVGLPKKDSVSWMHDHLKLIIAVAAFVGIIFSAYFFIEEKYASITMVQTEDLKISEKVLVVAERLDYKVTKDQFLSVQERIWILEDRHKNMDKAPQSVREEYKKLGVTKEMLQRRLEKLEEKGIGLKE